MKTYLIVIVDSLTNEAIKDFVFHNSSENLATLEAIKEFKKDEAYGPKRFRNRQWRAESCEV